jgi:hypothetical protein
MIKLPFDRITAIADRTTRAPPAAKPAVGYAIAKLLASISPTLPPPPPGVRYSVESIDSLIKDKPASERMRIKYELKMHDLLA